MAKTVFHYSEENCPVLAEFNKRITEKHGFVTVREFYRHVAGVELGREIEYNGELINPDDWGWDEKGFRQLFRTVVTVKRERL